MMNRRSAARTFIPAFSRLTLLCLLAGSVPAGVLAAWSAPGEDFSGELTVGGPVTDNRTPWRWKLMPGETDMSLRAGDRVSRGGEQVWSGLLTARPVLLGNTPLALPAGREGLAPKVRYGGPGPETTPNWLSDGEAWMTLPVYDGAAPDALAGYFRFRLRAAMLLRHTAGGQPVYAGIYNDLSGNGLPPEGRALPAARLAGMLCGQSGGDGPAWVCGSGVSVTTYLPLSRLTDGRLRQLQGVYGAETVAGSGELFLREGAMPARWKTTLHVSIEYQ
ncbi:F4 family fimbrial subunit [Citrobacter portucalensis]|uniref:F4 family fimbrial subunit n=1 Tax=Citrobacter portucalensis TaxID=1639133 RepID=UPI00288A17CE|nr:fimbrial protein [Citrobacter portucalensis]WNI84216.1 fimbrial protein [Citrobacter portucalensis]